MVGSLSALISVEIHGSEGAEGIAGDAELSCVLWVTLPGAQVFCCSFACLGLSRDRYVLRTFDVGHGVNQTDKALRDQWQFTFPAGSSPLQSNSSLVSAGQRKS